MSTTTLSYAVTARTLGGGVSAARWGDEEVLFDTAATPGATGLPGPADLLVAAFAACILKNVARFSEMLHFDYREASIRVTAERSASPPRMTKIDYALEVVTDEPARRVELLHRNIRQYGTIYNTLAAVCDVTGALVAVPTATAA